MGTKSANTSIRFNKTHIDFAKKNLQVEKEQQVVDILLAGYFNSFNPISFSLDQKIEPERSQEAPELRKEPFKVLKERVIKNQLKKPEIEAQRNTPSKLPESIREYPLTPDQMISKNYNYYDKLIPVKNTLQELLSLREEIIASNILAEKKVNLLKRLGDKIELKSRQSAK